ncbi:MAG TPA: DUF1289 domain-containing protein [Casimicrobiaceae bacterium]|nr:DUF1289 domain-containing protein [Casimicrobiaceae bacterium]
MLPVVPKAGVASPCINVCTLDARTGFCLGCQRTIDEIVAWGALDDERKRAVLAQLPARRELMKRPGDAER